MGIEQEPFRRYDLEKKVDSFTIRMNKEERSMFEQDKAIIEQVKDSTALKQLWKIGRIVIHDKKVMSTLDVLFKNKRLNKRIGIVDFADNITNV